MKKLVASMILLTFLIPYSLFAQSLFEQSLSAQNQTARSASNQNSSATYRVTFNATWSNETHPHPNDNFPGNPHFSPLIGAAHNANATFWQAGELASPGIKQMAETGGTSTLRSEVQAQIDSNNALAVLSDNSAPPSPGSATIDSFEVNQTFPLVTLVTMIAPSPDWFVGVSGVSLLDDQGQWLATHEVTLFPYDSGTDSGADYTSPNNVTDPAEPIARITGEQPFSDQPIGTLTFTLINVTSKSNGSATYRATFNATWSNETHPHPNDNFPGNPHFSPLIGAAHNANATFWQTGELASPGIEQMAETGGTSSLRSEVQEQIDSNNALAVLSGSSTTIDSFEVNQTFPLVTLVTMIAPSPDWFVGVSGVSLLNDQGQWLATHEVTLFPYDSGTDSGADYTSPNDDTDPAEPIARITGEQPFSDQPIGTLTFTLIEVTPPQWNVYLPLLQH